MACTDLGPHTPATHTWFLVRGGKKKGAWPDEKGSLRSGWKMSDRRHTGRSRKDQKRKVREKKGNTAAARGYAVKLEYYSFRGEVITGMVSVKRREKFVMVRRTGGTLPGIKQQQRRGKEM